MPKLRLLVFALLLLSLPALRATAQCALNPTVTPNNLLLCPNTQDTIRTQAFDTYQWYKDNVLLPGATKRYYVVDAYEDSGSEFKVAVAQGSCQDTSANVLVDGRAYAGVTVGMRGGATGYATDPTNGTTILCDSTRLFARDTLYLEMRLPYTTNVQWYRNGQLLPGATSTKLTVSEPGDYDAQGSPATCPNFVGHSLPITVELRTPTLPLITQVGGQLVATASPGDTLSMYQWYLNGAAIAGATSNTHTPTTSGTYWVQAVDSYCYTISRVFKFALLPTRGSALGRQTTIYPNPTRGLVRVEAPVGLSAIVRNLTGQVVRTVPQATQVDLSGLPDGLYLLQLNGPDGAVVKVEKIVKVGQ